MSELSLKEFRNSSSETMFASVPYLKRSSSINDFNHKIKEFYFEDLKKNMNLNKIP